jgi:hypothetical protein
LQGQQVLLQLLAGLSRLPNARSGGAEAGGGECGMSGKRQFRGGKDDKCETVVLLHKYRKSFRRGRPGEKPLRRQLVGKKIGCGLWKLCDVLWSLTQKK